VVCGTVWAAVDHGAARAADALAAVMIEGDGIFSAQDQPLVEDVEHLKERHVRADVVNRVGDQRALGVGTVLSPNADCDSHA
jgi:hypothetical protein